MVASANAEWCSHLIEENYHAEQPIVPAADTGLPGFQTAPDAHSRPSGALPALAAPSGGISRRAVLRATPAAVAAISLPTVAVASTDEIDRLIEAHREAHRAFIEAIRSEEALEQAYQRAYPEIIEVPSLLGGTLGRIYMHDPEHEAERFKTIIAEGFETHRQRVAKMLSAIDPDIAETARAAIDAAEAENQAVVDRVFAEEEARREAFGLGEARREWQRTCDAETAAQTAIAPIRAARRSRATGRPTTYRPDQASATNCKMSSSTR